MCLLAWCVGVKCCAIGACITCYRVARRVVYSVQQIQVFPYSLSCERRVVGVTVPVRPRITVRFVRFLFRSLAGEQLAPFIVQMK